MNKERGAEQDFITIDEVIDLGTNFDIYTGKS